MAPRRKVCKCSINECESREDQTNVTLFKVYESNKEAWESAVHNTVNNQLQPLNYICTKHFAPDDVITNYSQTPSDIYNYPDGNEDDISSDDENAALPFIPVQQFPLEENIDDIVDEFLSSDYDDIAPLPLQQIAQPVQINEPNIDNNEIQLVHLPNQDVVVNENEPLLLEEPYLNIENEEDYYTPEDRDPDIIAMMEIAARQRQLEIENIPFVQVPAVLPSLENQHEICVVCTVAEKTHALISCSHKVICLDCLNRLDPKRCPLCNEYFTVSMRI